MVEFRWSRRFVWGVNWGAGDELDEWVADCGVGVINVVVGI
jgi:hypothetical protein